MGVRLQFGEEGAWPPRPAVAATCMNSTAASTSGLLFVVLKKNFSKTIQIDNDGITDSIRNHYGRVALPDIERGRATLTPTSHTYHQKENSI